MSQKLPIDHTLVPLAYRRLRNVAKVTPIAQSSFFNRAVDAQVLFKCELFQRTGAFKFRGAYNAVSQLDASIKDVVTHSSGNHAAALCKAAYLCNKTAHIIMPNNSPIVKQNSVREYNGQITFSQPTQLSREETAAAKQKELSNAPLIHPSNDINVIAGQGTMGYEFILQTSKNNLQNMEKILSSNDKVSSCDISELMDKYTNENEEYLIDNNEIECDLDCILVPVGGGGMISGITLSILNFGNGMHIKNGNNKRPIIIGCEPLNADDAYNSKKENILIPNVSTPNTICDGLKTSLGSNTFPIISSEYVHSIIRVTEDEIIQGIKNVYQRMKLLIEPSAGVGPAVLMTEEFKQLKNDLGLKKIGIILCGGNADLSAMAKLFEQ